MDGSLPAGQLPLCRGCGVVGPLQASRCEHCQRELSEPRWWQPVAQQGLLWARVEASFECRACGHRSALNHLDVDGSVDCLSCGIAQRFDAKQWWTPLEHAHGVADLTGPHPEGLLPEPGSSIAQYNPHSELGVRTARAEVEAGEQTLRLSVSPGLPLCDACRAPLAVVNRAGGELRLGCSACRVERSYALPKKLSQRVRALVGILAREHELGRQQAVVHEEAGVTALRCPTCGAGLTLLDSASIVTCQYCQTSCHVAAQARPKPSKDAAPVPFWLLFEGPSRLREKLQNRAEAETNKAKKAAHADAQRAMAQREEARSYESPRAKKREKISYPMVGLMLGGTLVFGGVMAKIELDQNQRREENAAENQARARARAAEERAAVERRAANERPLAKQGAPFSVTINMDVVKAEGQPLQPGSPCVIYASGTGDSFEELHVSCGSALLYDSTTQIMGLRMMDRELYRSETDQTPNGLRYHDTGQRTNGSEITLDTRVGQAVISSQVVPLFRVELGPHREPKGKANAKR